MLENDFDALLTFDKNLHYQQNFAEYTIAVFVLVAPINTYAELSKLVPQVKQRLITGALPTGPIVVELG